MYSSRTNHKCSTWKVEYAGQQFYEGRGEGVGNALYVFIYKWVLLYVLYEDGVCECKPCVPHVLTIL